MNEQTVQQIKRVLGCEGMYFRRTGTGNASLYIPEYKTQTPDRFFETHLLLLGSLERLNRQASALIAALDSLAIGQQVEQMEPGDEPTL